MGKDAPCKVSLSFTVLAFLVGCSSEPRYSAPELFTVSNDAVAQVVKDAVAGDKWAAQIDGSPQVNCTGQTTCSIGYTVNEAIGAIFHKEHVADEQLILPTAQMWKAMFADPQFQRGTITVKGPVAKVGGETETEAYFILSCDRSAASKMNWDSVDGHGIRTHCDYQPKTRGLPGYA